MTDEILVCPSCDHSNPHERGSQRPRYRCLRCGHEFDEPNFREPRPAGAPTYNLYNLLDQADPDDIPPRGDA